MFYFVMKIGMFFNDTNRGKMFKTQTSWSLVHTNELRWHKNMSLLDGELLLESVDI